MDILIQNLTKSYGSQMILNHLSLTLNSGTTYCLMGPSGSGKTTLLRILLGLEQGDGGTILYCQQSDDNHPIPPVSDLLSGSGQQPQSAQEFMVHGFIPGTVTAVFQENRLCETFNPVRNVSMAVGNTISMKTLYQELCRLLPEEALSRPVHTLSGGMKRRVAILRAVLAPSQAIIMDEPFTGLDEETKHSVICWIKEKTSGKLLLVSTHQETDVVLLNGTFIQLTGGVICSKSTEL